MDILFLSAWFPYPPDNGSRIRIFNLLRHLSRRHEITLLSFINHERDRQWVGLLRSFCSKVEVVPGREFRPWSPRALLGTPVVATRKGAEGLEVTHGENILIADEPTEFADAVLRLLGDEPLRAKLAANERRLVYEQYRWERIAKKLERFLYQVVENHRNKETK